MLNRRDALLSGLYGAGYLGLRAMATGLPVWFLANPRRASAQALQCMIDAKDKMQFLIVSTSFNGDPLNCNCPGTYEMTDAIHPQQGEVEKTTLMLGSKSYGAALPWADPSVVGSDGTSKGQLKSAVLARTSFFHHMTRSTTHGDQPKVMKLQGAMTGGEMAISAYAKHLAPCFGTIQPEPVALGARGNAAEMVSYGGRTLPSISPTQLKQLLSGSKNDALVKLRAMRDTELSKLNAMAKQDGTKVQAQFLDTLANSQTQVRLLADALATTLNAITADDIKGQALAAAALFSAKVTPVATIHIGFGGDNHTDQNLQAEADQHVSGIAGIQAVMDAIASLQLTDNVTFATMNVFGRNLNGISKVSSRAGRDHYGNHNVGVLIGKNVAPSVIGGITAASSGAYIAADINSADGSAAAGGDIPGAQTMVAMARTLGVALGIPESALAGDFTSSAGGKVVKAALTI
jgi:hypothetical protein